MDTSNINFAIIEEALQGAESKEQLYAIFVASATGKLDSEANMLKGDNLPSVLKAIPSQFGISNEKANILILSLHSLLKIYISNASLDETVLADVFPADFKKSLKSFLFKSMRDISPLSKTYI
jgi:hypothetical protein